MTELTPAELKGREMSQPEKCPYCKIGKFKEMIGEAKSFTCSTFLFESPKGDHVGYECLQNLNTQQAVLLKEAKDDLETIWCELEIYRNSDPSLLDDFVDKYDSQVADLITRIKEHLNE